MSHLQLHGARFLQVRLWQWPVVSMPGHQLRGVPELHAGETGGQGQGTCGPQEDSRCDDQPRTLLNEPDICYCCMARVAPTSDLEWGAWHQLPVVTCEGCQVCTLIKQKVVDERERNTTTPTEPSQPETMEPKKDAAPSLPPWPPITHVVVPRPAVTMIPKSLPKITTADTLMYCRICGRLYAGDKMYTNICDACLSKMTAD